MSDELMIATPTVMAETPAMQITPASDSRALMSMIQTAMTRPDFDMDKLERLLAVKKDWEADEARKAYNLAFAEFRAEAVRIIKNKEVTAGPLQGKKYAELFAVVNAVTPALSRHGLSASWRITKDEKDWIEVTCTLKHNAGHFEAVSMGGPPDSGGAKNAIQARASTVSYLERYTLKAILGLSEQEDDDDAGKAGTAEQASKQASAGGSHSPTRLIFDGLQPAIQDALRQKAPSVCAAMPDAAKALDIAEMILDDWPDEDRNELKVGLWYLLDSKTRSAIKRHQQVSSITAAAKANP